MLEELIEKHADLMNRVNSEDAEDDFDMMDELDEIELLIIKFVISHTDELITWERTNLVRISPFDES